MRVSRSAPSRARALSNEIESPSSSPGSGLQSAEADFRSAKAGDGFPDVTEAAQAKVFASEAAIRVTNDALQIFGAAGYSRDVRMFTIGGGTAQILRTVVASRILGRKLPQTRDGYLRLND